jgi:hypothetical protein
MDRQEMKESIKKLWAQGITDSSIVCQVLSVSIEEYEAAVSQLKQEYSDYNKDSLWTKYIVQVQNRYVEIEEIKEAAMGKNKHQVALECVKAKSDLDLIFLNTAKENGVIDKSTDKIGKVLNDKKFEAVISLKKLKGDTNEYNSKDVSPGS